MFYRNSEFLQNDESQSSLQSSISATIEGSARKIRSKIEVVDPDGYVQFNLHIYNCTVMLDFNLSSCHCNFLIEKRSLPLT